MSKFFIYLSSILLPALSFAQSPEVHQCSGRWTNLPCDQVESHQTNRKVLTPEEAKERSSKESILHRLRMKSIEANRKYEIHLDLSLAEELCQSTTTALDVCRKEVERLDDKLDKKINSVALLRQREAKINHPSATQAPGQTTIIIRDRYPVYWRRFDPYNTNGSLSGNGPVIQGEIMQGNSQQIQQNVIIQHPPVSPPVAPTPQSSVGSWQNLP